jgi:hypothetical protein
MNKTTPTISLFILCASSAMAQQSIVEHCRSTSSDADRIACLEAALLGKDPVASAVPEPKSEPARAIVTKSAPEGIGASQVIARTETDEERIESLEKVEGLAVASYATVPYEKLQVTLENGQIWRQIVGDTQKIRVDLKRNQTVDIEESSLSGYKLRLNEMRRTVRVERVR